jgi:hypothetical protein
MNAEQCPTEEELLAIVAGDVQFESSHVAKCVLCQRRLNKLQAESTILRTTTANAVQSTTVQMVGNYPARIDKFIVVGVWDDNPLFVTYRGMHSVVRREVLIQVARAALCEQPNFQAIFRANCMQWMQPRTYMAKFLDAGEFQSRPYVVVEFIDGLRLDRLSSETQLDVANLGRLFEQVVEAFCADPTIYHPILDLSSIVADDNNQAVIVDWVAAIEFGRSIENFPVDSGSAIPDFALRRIAKAFCDAVFALDRPSPSQIVCYERSTLCDQLKTRGISSAVAKTLASIVVEDSTDPVTVSDLQDSFRRAYSKPVWRRLFHR